MAQAEQVAHPLAPVYDKNSKVLILGTMPSPASRKAGFYYMHPQNRFWKVICTILNEPLPDTIEEKRALLLRRGIALWETLASCEIEGAADAAIKCPVPNDFGPILETASLRAVFTTGKKAYHLYTKHCAETCGIPALLLPSSSPANCAVKFDALCDAYGAILPYLDAPKEREE